MYRMPNAFSVPQAIATTILVVTIVSLLNLLIFRFAEATDVKIDEILITPTEVKSSETDAQLTFSVTGVAAGTVVGETYLTRDDSTAYMIPFGSLAVDTVSTAAQQLAVNTDTSQGFTVTVQTNRQLTSKTQGADIDGYIGGTYTNVPTAWTSPTPIIGSENTYGHWGISSNDTTDMPVNFANGSSFVSASTSPTTIFNGNGSASEADADEDITTVIYRAEISALQEVSDDYTAQVTYVATPKI